MKINAFEIKNFKGIKSATISLLEGAQNGGVTTLIGLNESGKTSILEAISMFQDADPEVTSLVGAHLDRDSLSLIPKHLAPAFTGIISIKAFCQMSDEDVDAIAEYAINVLKLTLDKNSIPRAFSVDVQRIYTDSVRTKISNLWSLEFNLKKGRGKYKKYTGLAEKKTPEAIDVWRSIVRFINRRLPKIIYLPTFLFNFPDRIYLRESKGEASSYLVKIIQEILSKSGGGVSMQTHIIERLEKMRSAKGGVAGSAASQERELIDAVVLKISHAMTKVVFGSWSQILGGDVSGQRVEVRWGIDTEAGESPYLLLSIADGDHSFKLSERSLGFRWFFSFLLFIHLPQLEDGKKIIFLLDEPASNLHPKAQTKLLDSFGKITENLGSIVYSTHSHYLINPIWLDGAYIIKNSSHDMSGDGAAGLIERKEIDVKAIKYKTFVGGHPNKQSYFQPVLDALDVSISPMVGERKALIVEGKSDFYALKYFQRKMKLEGAFGIFPVDGSGGMSTLISLFKGWGYDFLILLDSDAAGQKERARYNDKFPISKNQILMLDEISSDFASAELEDIFREDVRACLSARIGESNLRKKQFWMLFYELLAANEIIDFPETEVLVGRLFDLVVLKINSPT